MHKQTLGVTFGDALGSSAAHLEHYVRSGATAIVTFTGDTGKGMAQGYARTSVARAAQRQDRAAARLAAQTPETPIGVLVTA